MSFVQLSKLGIVVLIFWLINLYVNQNKIYYKPNRSVLQNEVQVTPHGTKNGLDYFNLTLETDDGLTLKGWFMF